MENVRLGPGRATGHEPVTQTVAHAPGSHVHCSSPRLTPMASSEAPWGQLIDRKSPGQARYAGKGRKWTAAELRPLRGCQRQSWGTVLPVGRVSSRRPAPQLGVEGEVASGTGYAPVPGSGRWLP